jgi:serine/threonine protein phosphatase PrpC
MRCPHCGLEQSADCKFCEDCGARIGPPPPAVVSTAAPAGLCTQCGAGTAEVDGDGFCTRCGFERLRPDRDHLEIVLSPACAGVSDRGKQRRHNEDFLALASDEKGDVLVVCDGVSSSQHGAMAAEVAAQVVCAEIVRAIRLGTEPPQVIMKAALDAAQTAVLAVPYQPSLTEHRPQTTIVAALRQGRLLTLGWLGDSRAYLVGTAGATLLTEDHSWVNEVVAVGQLTRAEALQAPLAHSITRSLGAPLGPDGKGDEPSLVSCTVPEGPRWLILCSDGLWNYADEAAQLADVVHQQTTTDEALPLARALVDYACGRRGHDNITVAVLRL